MQGTAYRYKITKEEDGSHRVDYLVMFTKEHTGEMNMTIPAALDWDNTPENVQGVFIDLMLQVALLKHAADTTNPQ